MASATWRGTRARSCSSPGGRRALPFAGSRRRPRPESGHSSRSAASGRRIPSAATAEARRPRPPASVLGALIDRDGPEAFGATVARLGDGALVDTRVLLAHRLGADERRLAGRRGPLRVRPPAPRASRGPVARGVDAFRGRGPHPDRPRRPHARRAGRRAWRSAERWTAFGAFPRPTSTRSRATPSWRR